RNLTSTFSAMSIKTPGSAYLRRKSKASLHHSDDIHYDYNKPIDDTDEFDREISSQASQQQQQQ
ncbi:hypothetical protein EV182_005147, partial [Spiromyces aspiralis]